MVKEDEFREVHELNRKLAISNDSKTKEISRQEKEIQGKIKIIEQLEREIRDLNLLRILSQSGILRGLKLDVIRVQDLVEKLINSQLEPIDSQPSD